MKKNYILLALALTAALSSCDKQTAEFESNSNAIAGSKMTMTASRTDGTDTNTRTSIDGLTFAWAETDKLGVYLKKQDAQTTFTHLSGAGTGNASFTGTLDPDNEYIYATYPETAAFEGWSGVRASFTLPIEQIQKHKEDGSIDPISTGNYAYMYGRTKRTVNASTDFSVKMKHLMTFLDFNITDLPKDVVVRSLSITEFGANETSVSMTVDLDQDGSPVSNVAPTLTVKTEKPMTITSGAFTFRSLMFPTSVTGSTRWDIYLTTSTGGYLYTKNFDKAKIYEAGKCYNVPLSYNSFVEVVSVSIPDVNFKKYLVTYFDDNGDGEISNVEALEVTKIYCTDKNLKSLEGIASFKNLTNLNCNRNQLTSLDISANTALTVLDCSENPLTSLNLADNTALISLDCCRNHLTSLDLSGNTALISLDCQNNLLPSLDVSNNTVLTSLNCRNNHLTSLNVSGSTALATLDCQNNLLPSLDVSNNTMLTALGSRGNHLTSLNVSGSTALTSLDCGDNQLPSLDVSNNAALTSLDCGDNELSSLDVSNNIALISLACYGNQLPSLDVSNNTMLTGLSCYSNQLPSLDVSNNAVLTYLKCYSNAITTLNICLISRLYIFNCDPMKGNGSTNLLKTLTHRADQILSGFSIPAETELIVGK